MLWQIANWTMSAIGLAGTLINAERNKWGFPFWLVSNLYMTIRFAVIGEYDQMVLFFIYFLLAIRGIVSWTKKEKREGNTDQRKRISKEIKDFLKSRNENLINQ